MTEGRKSSGFSVDSNVFLTIVKGGFRLRKPKGKCEASDANTEKSIFNIVCDGTDLPLVVWGCLWQTVGKVSAAPHQTHSLLQTETAQHDCTENNTIIWAPFEFTTELTKARLTFRFTSWPVMCVPMVWATTLHQRFDVPCLRFTAAQQLFKLQKERKCKQLDIQMLLTIL